MASKKKLATAAVAVAAAAAVMMSGTFAWQSISQTALNEASDVINPGGRLHDDFNGENKDIYVENFADEDIYARIRLSEYFEVVMNYDTKVETREQILGGEDDQGERTYTLFTGYDSDGELSAGMAQDGTSYWNWITGGETLYMPTFNMNKDSLEADVNGIYESGIVGTISDRILDLDSDDAQYRFYTNWAEFYGENGVTGLGATKMGTEIYDGDANSNDEVGNDFSQGNLEEKANARNVVLVDTTEDGFPLTHAVKQTGNGTLMSMQEWIDNGSQPGNYWVYDTDGWVYWAQAIEPDTATGLLLDSIELNQVMDDTWYYAIHVEAQFVTADDVGKKDGTGFYVEGTAPTAEAEELLKAIGVFSVDEEAGENGGENEDPQSPLQLTVTADPNWYIPDSSMEAKVNLTASAAYEGTEIEELTSVTWSISGNEEAGTVLSDESGESVTLTIAPSEKGNITVTASFTYMDEEQGIDETVTAEVEVTNGPYVATMWVFDNAEQEPDGFSADSYYIPGQAKTFDLTTYFFPNHVAGGGIQPIEDAYDDQAAELLAQKYHCELAENYTGVTFTQNGADMTVNIDETATETIVIHCKLDNSMEMDYEIYAGAPEDDGGDSGDDDEPTEQEWSIQIGNDTYADGTSKIVVDGEYTVSVVDGNGEQVADATIELAAASADKEVKGISLSNNNNGSATVTVSGEPAQGTQTWKLQVTANEETRVITLKYMEVILNNGNFVGMYEELNPDVGAYYVSMEGESGSDVFVNLFGVTADDVDYSLVRVDEGDIAANWSVENGYLKHNCDSMESCNCKGYYRVKITLKSDPSVSALSSIAYNKNVVTFNAKGIYLTYKGSPTMSGSSFGGSVQGQTYTLYLNAFDGSILDIDDDKTVIASDYEDGYEVTATPRDDGGIDLSFPISTSSKSVTVSVTAVDRTDAANITLSASVPKDE